MCICEVPGTRLPNCEFYYQDLPGGKVNGEYIKFGEIEHIECGRKIVCDYIPKEERHKYSFNFR